MSIRIITDSTSDIPANLLKEYGIIQLPLTVCFGQEQYRDRLDLTPAQFFKKLAEGKALPTTSQVNPSAFVDAYKKVLDEGDSIISIHISADLSGTYQSAEIAKQILGDDRISVIDSRTATLSLGKIVLKAAELVRQGMNHNDVVKNIEEYKNTLKLIIVVDTLEYLKRGGRLSGTQALIGEMLNIKPMLTIDGGKVIVIDKVRGHKRALIRIIEIMKERGSDLKGQTVGIANAAAPEVSLQLKEMMAKEFGIKEFIETEVGCVISTHTGPGAYGVIYR